MENCYWPILNHTDEPLWLLPPASTSAPKSHSEVEKRRRDRINAQLSTLRKLIPKFEKMDKAALLGHVVDHVKEQRQRTKEAIKISSGVPSEIDEMDKAALLGHVVDHVKEQRQRTKEAIKISSGVPSEIDEVIIDQIEDGSEQIKASIGRSSSQRSGAR
ncbi:hypothetical protein SASPL_122807 [Salvia splendens]|uniref:BHLH domain-containing protein n=1 Tax=Salvia splendens TaxID=180675 RepID=A0A8X8XQ03_SALSN|nr:hypothetical protein SASPL_122807 [Salvia splendens]